MGIVFEHLANALPKAYEPRGLAYGGGAPVIESRPSSFETTIFETPVSRLLLSDNLDIETVSRKLPSIIDQWRKDRVWLASCRIPAQATDIGASLENHGFRRIETLIDFVRPIKSDLDHMPDLVVEATERDASACEEIGRTAFLFDRFHTDPEIDKRKADALKAAWVRNGFAGRAHSIVVVRERSVARGFVLCMLNNKEAIIDLIAVAPGHERLGYGKLLVAGAFARYAGTAATLIVRTQATNLASLKLYQRMEFRETTRAHTFHWVNGDVRV